MTLLLSLLLLGSFGPKQAARNLDKARLAPQFADAHWGIQIYAPMRNRVIYNYQAHHNFRPASNAKILTTLLALEHLGPDYRFNTEIAIDGPLVNGTLRGNLIIVAGGDPSMSGNYSEGSYHTRDVIHAIAKAIGDLGIQTIEGQILSDTRKFPDSPLANSWEWSDLIYYYGVPPTGLSAHDGWIEFEFQTDEHGALSWSMWPPHLPDFSMTIEMTNDEEAEAWARVERTFASNHFHIKGNLPRCTDYRYVQAAWEPHKAFAYLLRDSLQQQDIPVKGQTIPRGPLTNLDAWQSPTLAELAKTLMVHSQNYYADIFWRVTGFETSGDSSLEGPIPLANDLIEKAALWEQAKAGQQNRDGSGLSAQNNLKPSQLVSLLNYALQQSYREPWLQSLGQAGKQGTLARRNVSYLALAKTGYINRSRTLSGYLETHDGELLIFSFMANNYACATGEIDDFQDDMLRMLSELRMPQRYRHHPYYKLLTRAGVEVPR